MDEIESVTKVEQWALERGLFPGHRFFKTSGSSGLEKWVALSNEALEWSARTVNRALGIGSADVLGLALPEIHVGGYGLVVRARVAGACLARFERRWQAAEFADWCRKEGVTVTSLVPTQVHDLVEAGECGSPSLRVVVVGGGALNDELKQGARELGWPVEPSYGMTETASQVATGDGLPLLPGWEARVVEGRLALRGGGLLSAVIRRGGEGFVAEDPKEEGWFLTNDRAELRGRSLTILGRADRLVKVLGELVDLEAVENQWREDLGEEAVVVAQPDARRGKSLHLFHEGKPRDLDRRNRERSGPERLSSWQAMAKLPRSPLGKLDRGALQKDLSKIHQDKDCNHSGIQGI